MDTSGYFAYPTPQVDEARATPGFLDQADKRAWDTLLAGMQTLILRPGDTVFSEGQADRAFYLLTDGVLEITAAGEAPTTVAAPPAEVLNEMSFVDGGGCTATARAVTDGRVLRLNYDAFEALAAREPHLGRQIALDLALMLALRLRHRIGQRN
jgi:CRP-like cAMP-binding protein